jgi:death on curing protein
MMLAQHGGLAGVRDEAALAKPSNLFAYRKPELTEMAASYAVGIVKNRHSWMETNEQDVCWRRRFSN